MKIPPNDLQAEKDLMWLVLWRPELIPVITTKVTAGDFYNALNCNNFKIAVASYTKDKIVDFSAMQQVWAYDSNYVSEQWLDRLAKKIREASKKRALFMMAAKVADEAEKKPSEEVINYALGRLLQITKATEAKRTDAKTLANKVLKRWIETKDRAILGLSSGYPNLDDWSGGLQKGHLWVVGGYTNYGKTTFAISLLARLMNEDKSVLFCSMEMSQEQIIEKLVSNLTRETPNWNRKNCELGMVQSACNRIAESMVHVSDNLCTVEAIILKCQQMTAEGIPPEVVFVDFIQNIQGKGVSEYERITNAILQIQQAARELNTCFVVLSQVNNQSAKIESETIGFKSSGALAAAADFTIQLTRDKVAEVQAAADGTATDHVELKLVVQKSRHGRGGVDIVEFDKSKGLILNH